MADHINFSVHCRPIEELTDEQGNIIKILSGEVNTSLGGSGDSIDIANYSGSGTNQGYANGAVAYKDITHADGGTVISQPSKDFYFIKNTGFKFSSSTVLGSSTTDCIMVVLRELAHSSSSTGGFRNSSNADELHFYEIAWLQPGQGIVLPLGAAGVSSPVSQYGSNSDDLSKLGATGSLGQANVSCKTFLATGGAASDGNALEMLVVG